MTEDAEFRQAYAICRDYAQSRTHGYGIGTQWLPPSKRPYCDALLAFAMHTDTLADDTNTPPNLRRSRFQDWCDTFAAVYDGQRRGSQIEWSLCLAFVDTMGTWGLSRQSVNTYFDAQAAEVTFTHFATYDQLRFHADELIGTTCVWANVIYGGTSPEAERRARQLAMASQLSDYLVDLRIDLSQGRLYLPLEDLERFGVERSALEWGASAGKTPHQIRKLVLFEAGRAREFCDAGSGWELLVDPSARDAAWLPGAVYRHQLEQIERSEGDIFGTPPVRVEELGERVRLKLAREAVSATRARRNTATAPVERPVNCAQRRSLPVHFGIILDGNRRWARKRGVPSLSGTAGARRCCAI